MEKTTTTDTKKLRNRRIRNGFIAGVVALNMGLMGCASYELSDSGDSEKQPEWVKEHTKQIESIDKSTTDDPMNYVYTYETKDGSLKQSTIKSYWDDMMFGEFDTNTVVVREDANTANTRIEIYHCDYTEEEEEKQEEKKNNSSDPLDFFFGEDTPKCSLPRNANEMSYNKLEIHVPKGTLKDLKDSSKSTKEPDTDKVAHEDDK